MQLPKPNAPWRKWTAVMTLPVESVEMGAHVPYWLAFVDIKCTMSKLNVQMTIRTAKRCTSSVNNMLSQIGWDILENRRKEARLSFLFKLYHGNSKLDVSSIILEPNYIGKNDHHKKIRRLQSKLLPYHNSYFPKTIRDWNKLPKNVFEAVSIDEFKELLQYNQTCPRN